MMSECRLCPRLCGVDRRSARGFCGAGEEIEVSKIMLHHWEEPPISGDPRGERGSGAIFFTHCSLGCVYCQNRKISVRRAQGESYSPARLAAEMLRLEEQGAYNINLVTPTHYSDALTEAVHEARKRGLSVPVVWNTGGYELPEVIESLRGTVDIFLTDFKYASSALAERYSGAPDYPERARASLEVMAKIAGPCEFRDDGMMKRGVIVRHLVLPSHADDSIRVLCTVAETTGTEAVRLSLMAQYTPDFLPPSSASSSLKPDAEGAERDRYRSLRRRVTTYEYDKVSKEAVRLGFDGWMQERSSAVTRFTPDF